MTGQKTDEWTPLGASVAIVFLTLGMGNLHGVLTPGAAADPGLYFGQGVGIMMVGVIIAALASVRWKRVHWARAVGVTLAFDAMMLLRLLASRLSGP